MSKSLYISHASALHYWRTNPPWYVLEGSDRNIRALANCPQSASDCKSILLSEADFGPGPHDILVPSDKFKHAPGFRMHVQRGKLPRHSLYPLYDGVYVVSPELCFVQMCNHLGILGALQLGMELCGTYALRPGSIEGMASRDYELIDSKALQRHVSSWERLRGLVPARRAAQYLVNGSASPMETNLYLLLCLPQLLGGYNLPHPELNPKIELPGEAQLILHRSLVKPDFLWREHMLVLEYDGRYHDSVEQATHDEMRHVVLETMGYDVLRIKRQQVYDPLAFDSVARALARKLGRRLRTQNAKQATARETLRRFLLEQEPGI